MKKNDIISHIAKLENTEEENLIEYIKSFEKCIKSQIKNYDDTSGLDDYKMNKKDYIILFELYTNTETSSFKLHIILLYMYAYYKLDGIDFNETYFPKKLFFKFIKKNHNMHKIILDCIINMK